MRFIIRFFSIFLLGSLSANAIDFTKKKEVKDFIKMMKKEFNYDEKYLNRIFSNIKEEQKIKIPKKTVTKKIVTKKTAIKKSQKPKPQGSWDIYARNHLDSNRANLGVAFMHKHKKILKKAQEKYGVPPEYITAIIGIESYYGKRRGIYHVLEVLTYQAFGDNKRKKFYQYQLQEFLRMCYREQVEPRRVKGSKAGAIGLAQFMPSNYKSLAVDFNNDGKIRISNPTDAIGSIANYFKENGWRTDEPVGTRVSYKGNRFYSLETGTEFKYKIEDLIDIRPRRYFPYRDEVHLIKLERENYDELWYGTHNFYVITRYNHSSYYAMAVHQLAEKIKTSYIKKHKKNKLYLATK